MILYVNYSALHRQIAVFDYLKIKQLLLFGFAFAQLTYSHDGEMLDQCCFNVGPASTTLAQH